MNDNRQEALKKLSDFRRAAEKSLPPYTKQNTLNKERNMNIVLVNHFGSAHDYAFSVPDEIVPFVKKGTVLVVSTRKGVDIGRAVSGVISGDGALDVASRCGARELKPVVGFIDENVYGFCANVAAERVSFRPNDVLPF